MWVEKFYIQLHTGIQLHWKLLLYQHIVARKEQKHSCKNKEHKVVAEPISMSTPQMNYVNENSQNNRKEQRRGNDNNKWQFYFVVFTSVYVNVRGSCMWPSARLGDVGSWYSRVVDVRSWAFDEGRWHRSSRWVQLDSRRGQLRSVESLGTAGQSSRAAEVSRGW